MVPATERFEVKGGSVVAGGADACAHGEALGYEEFD